MSVHYLLLLIIISPQIHVFYQKLTGGPVLLRLTTYSADSWKAVVYLNEIIFSFQKATV